MIFDIVNWKCELEQDNNLWIKQQHIHLNLTFDSTTIFTIFGAC
jgi:hypothetical protein